jgi:hypothetical protein
MSLEPYLKGSGDKDDQEIGYLVVLIYRTLLTLTRLTFQPEFLARTMTTIATGMTSVSLKVCSYLEIVTAAFERKCARCVSHRGDVE